MTSPRRSTHVGRAVDGEFQDKTKDGRCGCCTRSWVDCWVYSDRTVRDLRKQFCDNEGMLDERRQGKYDQMMVYKDEELNNTVVEWVRENAFKNGEPKVNAPLFCI